MICMCAACSVRAAPSSAPCQHPWCGLAAASVFGPADHPLHVYCLLQKLNAAVLCKCVGFEINEANERVLGRAYGHLDPSLWIVTEPHLDHTMFQSLVTTSGHMNMCSLFGKLILRYDHDPSAATWLGPDNPRFRINRYTTSDLHDLFAHIARCDPGACVPLPSWLPEPCVSPCIYGCLLTAHVKNTRRLTGGQTEIMDCIANLSAAFCKTMSPDAYLVNNETLWDGLHAMLSRCTDASHTAVASRLGYPFRTILSELPDLKPAASPKEHAAGAGDVVHAFGKRGKLHKMLNVESSLRGLTNPTISCLTFFEGTPPTDVLRERLQLMATSNPWISGRLRSGEDGAVHCWIPAAPELPLVEATMRGLRPEAPVSETMAKCSRYGARLGLEAIDRDEPLFRVCLLHTGAGRFALLVSLCHALGDAATFYRLYAMMDPSGGQPERLDFTRVPTFTAAALRESFGAEATSGHTQLPSSCPKGVSEQLKMYDAITRVAARQKDVTLAAVDAAWVAEQKAACAPLCTTGTPYVSTNDILAAWYFRKVGASHGTVACDCRGRLPGVRDAAASSKAGNYISSIVCSPADYASALRVRQKVATTLKLAARPSALSGARPPEVAMPRVVNITNWSTLYHHVEFPGCHTLVHFPIIDSTADVTHANLYLFRPHPGELAALNFMHGADQCPVRSRNDATFEAATWAAGEGASRVPNSDAAGPFVSMREIPRERLQPLH